MKKTYKAPSFIEVKLSPAKVIAYSEVELGSPIEGTDVVEGDVKGFSNKNIWDEQW